MVRLNDGRGLDLDNFHGGGALEELRHDAFVRRVQVLDDDTGHAASLRHVFQELFEGLNRPAEAPMPTMGKTSSLCRGGISSFAPAAGLLSLPPRLDGFVTVPSSSPGQDWFGRGSRFYVCICAASIVFFFMSGLMPLCIKYIRLTTDKDH